MILNPPNIVLLLKAWQQFQRIGATGDRLAEMLAGAIGHQIGHQTYDAFLRTYQLFLQSIPLETAKAAWGINAALASAATRRKP